MTITMRAAAEARSARVAALADRPSQRRCAEEPGSLPRVSARLRDLDLRASADGKTVEFDGYASVTAHPYEMWDAFGPYTEQVTPGAFTTTLAQAGLDVPLVLQHMDLRRIARTTNGTLTLTEDTTGLHTLATLDTADVDVQYILPKLRAGLVDEMSFKFRITSGSWSPDWTEYHIEQVDIHRGDVAIVGFGANPGTAGAGIRGLDVDELIRALDDSRALEVLDSLRVRFAPAAPDLAASIRARFGPAAPSLTARAVITDDDVRLRLA